MALLRKLRRAVLMHSGSQWFICFCYRNSIIADHCETVPEAIERVAATEVMRCGVRIVLSQQTYMCITIVINVRVGTQSTAAGVRVADWVVERLDLSGFGPHVTMETLRAVNDMMPHIREIRLLPPKRLSAARTRSIYDVEV
jgi:hypothetical protein